MSSAATLDTSRDKEPVPAKSARVRVRRLLRILLLALALALVATPSYAQRQPINIDGEMWLQSSPDERKVFLIGASSMTNLETAYAQKKGLSLPPAGSRVNQALAHMTLDEASNRITRWYEANPGRRDLPPLGVLWVDVVDPSAAAKLRK